MNDYILLMHDDAERESARDWPGYLARLRRSGSFEGGSSIGDGVCMSKSGSTTGITSHLAGYIVVRAKSLEAAKALVPGNPVFEAGGTVEVRELPRDA